MGETKIEEVRQKTQATLDMLQSIRTDVCSHLPELHLPSVGVFANSFHDVPVINGMRSHLPTFSPIPSLADMCAKLEAIRTRLHGVDFHPQAPLAYLPTLSTHLNTLEEHLSSIELPRVSGFAPSAILSDVLDTFLHSDLVSDLMDAAHEVKEGEERLEKAAMDIAHAIKRSLQGSRLIEYTDLPHQWRNNPFVLRGYRFIPIEKWPLILRSIFALHNETMNIHTHLIPCLLWGISVMPATPNFNLLNLNLNLNLNLDISYLTTHLNTNATTTTTTTAATAAAAVTTTVTTAAASALTSLLAPALFATAPPPPASHDLPEQVFTAFALLCLFSSAVWHTMAGCAHHASMDFCARVDYVGIGWLISASVATVVYYGFQCHPALGYAFLLVCLVMGILGNILPFMKWFNQIEYRFWRIAFFLAMAFSAVAPLAALAYLHGTRAVLAFVSPIAPSLASYLVGLAFYAAHVPERFMNERWRAFVDSYGIGSHCIWHCFIVLAVSQHKTGMQVLKLGISCAAP